MKNHLEILMKIILGNYNQKTTNQKKITSSLKIDIKDI